MYYYRLIKHKNIDENTYREPYSFEHVVLFECFFFIPAQAKENKIIEFGS